MLTPDPTRLLPRAICPYVVNTPSYERHFLSLTSTRITGIYLVVVVVAMAIFSMRSPAQTRLSYALLT